MMPAEIAVPGPIVLIPSNRSLTDLENQVTPFVEELNQLTGRGALPVTLETTRDGWRMAVYTSRYVAWLYPTSDGDGYRLGHAARRQFRDEDRLVKRALLVRCSGGFRAFPDLRTFNDMVRAGAMPRTSDYADVLWHAWQHLEAATGAAPQRPAAHSRQLDLLDLVVEASRRIELDKQTGVPPEHYVSRRAAREQRYSARGVYCFRTTRRSELTTNTMVCLGELPEFRGSVIRVDGKEVTVRFEPGSDFDQIANQGTLKVLPGTRIFRAQRDAIALLRKGEARNPRLLDNLFSADFLPYLPSSDVMPQRRLDADQLHAFHRALDVPDMLTVLGPPGAGKTTTITEVVQACAARGERVLITSHTHRAVDNVLESLPPGLNVVRIGNEDRMSGKIRAMSSASRVEAVRQEVLSDSGLFDTLSEIRKQRPLLDRYLAHLGAALDRAQAAQETLDRWATAAAEAVRQASGPLRPQLTQAEQNLARQRSVVVRQESSLAQAQRRLATARAKADSGSPLAFLHRWLVNWQHDRVQRAQRSLTEGRAHLEVTESGFADLWAQAEKLAAGDPQVIQLTAHRQEAQQRVAAFWPEASRVGGLVHQALRPAVAMPPLPPPTVSAWREFHDRCVSTLDTLERRALLLHEWRDKVADLSSVFERELARYADVVGATCIGTDTSALVSRLDFDLAIVDEAGQISTPNLLVPLVRARRAILVGDHKQLPPFLDEEVRRWSDGLVNGTNLTAEEIPQVGELLARSGFELLFPRAGAGNAVWLRTQRRMPIEIANFISDTFYSGQLRTEHPGCEPNSLFTSPFAMVDTSDQPAKRRGETEMRRLRSATQHGYRNELEAEIIAGLVSNLRGHYKDWAVIVPFNAQKELVVTRLAEELGESSEIVENVGSVDSFQGGERDLIVFGFTRSNSDGNIGFLKEIRRFNVAVTRARRQLVLVGDLSTLQHARNREFRDIMRSLSAHLASAGDLRPSLKVTAALAAASGRRP
jgi:hypothetical protein